MKKSGPSACARNEEKNEFLDFELNSRKEIKNGVVYDGRQASFD